MSAKLVGTCSQGIDSIIILLGVQKTWFLASRVLACAIFAIFDMFIVLQESEEQTPRFCSRLYVRHFRHFH